MNWLALGVVFVVVGGLVIFSRRGGKKNRLRMEPELFRTGFSRETLGVNRVLAMATSGEDEGDYGEFLAQQFGIDTGNPLLIEVVDTSSSMAKARKVFPGAQRAFYERLLARIGPRIRLLQFWGTTRPRMVGPPPGAIQWLPEYICLSEEQMVLRTSSPEGVTAELSAGVLEGGSSISDWIRVLGELALAYKRLGVPSVTLVIHTDGYNRNGAVETWLHERWQIISEVLAKDVIEALRRANVSIQLIGVVSQNDARRLKSFVDRLGLFPMNDHGQGEARVLTYREDDPASLRETFGQAFELTSHSIQNTLHSGVECSR